MMDPVFRAEIELLSTEEGGRRGAIVDGYRPDLSFGIGLHGVMFQFHGELLPGQKGHVTIVPFFYETWPVVGLGTQFDICEGSRTVGHGTLVEY